MRSFRKIWGDDAGFVVSAELASVATIVVIGLTVGLVSLRNQVVQELVDVGQAIGSLSQSYGYGGVLKPRTAWTDGSYYIDVIDYCQVKHQVPGTEPGGITVRDWPPNLALTPPGGEIGEPAAAPVPGPGAAEAATSASLLCKVFENYPLGLLRAEVDKSIVVCQDFQLGAVPTVRTGDKQMVVSYKLAVWVDPQRYDQFQQRLVQQLWSLALRRGEWLALTAEHQGAWVVENNLLPVGSTYEGVRDIQAQYLFRPGQWGTDRANLGKETVLLVNTLRDQQNARTNWAWFNIPRLPCPLRPAVQVRLELIGQRGNVLAQQIVPIRVGYNATPPGLEVFDVYNRREADFRTLSILGANNPVATADAAASRAAAPGRVPEDMLVFISPYIMLASGGDPPRSLATRVVVPLTTRFDREPGNDLKEIRATVLAAQ